MVISLALIFLVGLTAAAICRRIALPRIIGMLLAGILLGPFALNALLMAAVAAVFFFWQSPPIYGKSPLLSFC